jgi:hypothetical protein
MRTMKASTSFFAYWVTLDSTLLAGVQGRKGRP